MDSSQMREIERPDKLDGISLQLAALEPHRTEH